MKPIEKVLAALPHPPQGALPNLTTRCPGHDDKRSSLSISEKADGTVLIRCHARCDLGHILDRLGLVMKDLFPGANGNGRRPPGGRPAGAAGAPRGKILEVYPYHAIDGRLLFEVCRFEPKDFRPRLPDGTWKNLPSSDRVLYRLPQVAAAIEARKVIWVVEGEKDVHTLERLNLVGTTIAGGAAAPWHPGYTRALAGASVAILPDNDDPGRQFAAKIAAALHGTAARVRVIQLPGLPPKGDVTDWAAGGGSRDALIQLDKASPDWAPPRPLPRYPRNDSGNALRLIDIHGDRIRFCRKWNEFLVWDDRRWQLDEVGRVFPLCDDVPPRVLEESKLEGVEDEKKALIRWANTSGNLSKKKAMLEDAGTRERIRVTPQQLDADLYSLNVGNGTIDLRTGELRPHRREDLITKLIPVDFDPFATCPTWDGFLQWATREDETMVTFLQRAVGYTLTGDVSEQVFFLLIGSGLDRNGSNGKSTFLESILDLMGEFGQKSDFETFVERRTDVARYDIADLRGSRYVAASELGLNRRLDEAVIKQITGGEKLKARQIYEKGFEFTPQFKLWLAANHKPVIRGQDHGIWRRPLLIPFENQILDDQKDKHLPEKLVREWPGILAWAVKGAKMWATDGLQVPARVRAATQRYRVEMDPLKAFLEDRCFVGADAMVQVTKLRKAYMAWTLGNGDEPIGNRNWISMLEERGYSREKLRHGIDWWKGLGLKDLPPDLPPEDGADQGDKKDPVF